MPLGDFKSFAPPPQEVACGSQPAPCVRFAMRAPRPTGTRQGAGLRTGGTDPLLPQGVTCAASSCARVGRTPRASSRVNPVNHEGRGSREFDRSGAIQIGRHGSPPESEVSQPSSCRRTSKSCERHRPATARAPRCPVAISTGFAACHGSTGCGASGSATLGRPSGLQAPLDAGPVVAEHVGERSALRVFIECPYRALRHLRRHVRAAAGAQPMAAMQRCCANLRPSSHNARLPVEHRRGTVARIRTIEPRYGAAQL